MDGAFGGNWGKPLEAAPTSSRELHMTPGPGGYQLLSLQNVGEHSSLSSSVAVGPSSSSSSQDIVQFTCPIYFVSAEEGRIECDIMRIGKRTGTLGFTYETAIL